MRQKHLVNMNRTFLIKKQNYKWREPNFTIFEKIYPKGWFKWFKKITYKAYYIPDEEFGIYQATFDDLDALIRSLLDYIDGDDLDTDFFDKTTIETIESPWNMGEKSVKYETRTLRDFIEILNISLIKPEDSDEDI